MSSAIEQQQNQQSEEHQINNQIEKEEWCKGNCMEERNDGGKERKQQIGDHSAEDEQNGRKPANEHQLERHQVDEQLNGAVQSYVEQRNVLKPENGCNQGVGYASPMDAFRYGPREKFLFVLCPNADRTKPDMLATVDVDPESSSYCKVVGRLDFPYVGDEVHHSGWNACSSCYGDKSAKRSHLILPCLNSSRIYIVDVTDPQNLKLHKVIEPEVLFKEDVSFPHTSHCLADGTVMISTLGTADGSNKGDFFVLDGKTFEPKGTWPAENSKKPDFNYDFWYQPRRNVMISTEWGTPKKLKNGFKFKNLVAGEFGNHLNVWNFSERKLVQKISLEKPEGYMPFEIRFLHEPTSTHGFVLTSFGSSLYHFYKSETNDKVVVEKVFTISPKSVRKWLFPEMPAMLADLIISLDDKYLYISVWLHGEVRQYDISDPFHPKLVGQVNVGGMLHFESPVVFKTMSELKQRPAPTYVKGKRIEGGAQMLQLSLDGKRLYVNTSLYTSWDFQMQPSIKNGTQMVMIDVNTEDGGLKINKDFLVDFGALQGGPFLAHEMRYPGGDCTSDIWV